MSKSNPFGWLDATTENEKDELSVSAQNRLTGFTLAELVQHLQKILKDRPELRTLQVAHEEYGGVTPTTNIETDLENNRILIS